MNNDIFAMKHKMPSGNRMMLKWNQNREFNHSLEVNVLDLDHSVAIIPAAQMRVVGGERTLVDEANAVGCLVLWSRLTCNNITPIQFAGYYLPFSSVADRECLSRIPDSECYPSRNKKQQPKRCKKSHQIPDPPSGSATLQTHFTIKHKRKIPK
jgi:hypothetical protein